jgi:hypothetical protein
MPDDLSPDASFALLYAAGWSVGELPLLTADGSAWLVTGANGENVIEARAATQAEAWHRAVEQAAVAGDAGPRLPLLIGGSRSHLMGTLHRDPKRRRA